MNRFPLPLVVQRNGADHLWRFREPFCYITRANQVIWIEAGFECDFASIPRWLWTLYPPWSDDYINAACIHDGLYASEKFARKHCDVIFYEAMADDGATWFDRNVFYAAVRAGGSSVWAAHTIGPGGTVELGNRFVHILSLEELAEKVPNIIELIKKEQV